MKITFDDLIFGKHFQNLLEDEKQMIKEVVFTKTYSFDDFVELLKQVREATIQECIRNIQVEHRTYNVNGEYKSELLGEEILYNIAEVWNYMSTNAKELNKLDKDSIEL
jgi:hypothetical protein